ncbi:MULTISPECIES: O-antigen ligase family protein [unclassified Methylobacterium]|uniref:O-antigen ligase family protein n=1 Tax=unclassified Methylobacterium TaxID=2615210 RepID=UPI0011C1E5D1|nr:MULTISPECIES: O-antigen ligase family protein [unclassified Methylobacterium]QEE42096.1 O-antigen ligase family protein [Methylobacterium sp. WL1]TXN59046.1 O-antigen ligase family protein [Methylobacterium sp. WL2]
MAQTAAPAIPVPSGLPAGIPLLGVIRGLAMALFAAFIFFACFAFSETSPYDAVAIPTILLWLCLGVRLHRGAVPLLALLLLYLVAIVTALFPYLNEEFPVTWTIQLIYLVITCVFFAMFFSEDTHARMELALKAYTVSCVFSAALGIVGYLQWLGIEDLFYKYDRASGTFQDPNVFGSFLTLGALYLMHSLLTGSARRPLVALAGLLIILAGIFLSFSRGSWGGSVVAVLLMVGSVYAGSGSVRLRRRIVLLTLATLVLATIAVIGLLSVEHVHKMFETRAALTQDYDQGETGRFGNQVRGLAMLLERPFGMGPMHWRLVFGLEPHNSYIGSFANGGWLGGVVFIGLVLATSFVGFRLLVRPSPVRAHAQIVWPALLMFFLQAFQIDIEKWRHVYMMLGMVWALEAARLRAPWIGGTGRP